MSSVVGAKPVQVTLPVVKPWVPAHPDAPLPASVSLRSQMPPAWDQGVIGSGYCEANAFARHYQHARLVAGCKPAWTPSRAFLNRQARIVMGWPVGDGNNAPPFNAVAEAALRYGCCPESMYEYRASHLLDTFFLWFFKHAVEPPPASAIAEAAKHRISGYASLTARTPDASRYDTDVLKRCLAEGHSFVVGIVFYNRLHCTNHILDIPPEYAVTAGIGTHALCAHGYDARGILATNSFGPSWDGDGDLVIPWSFAQNPRLMYGMLTVTGVAG